jgi:hypothetical protein
MHCKFEGMCALSSSSTRTSGVVSQESCKHASMSSGFFQIAAGTATLSSMLGTDHSGISGTIKYLACTVHSVE